MADNPLLHPVELAIDDLTPDPRNARLHDDRNVDSIKASLATHGQQKPIVVCPDGNVIVAGNGLVEAARQLGWETVIAVYFEGSDDEAKAYGIADNRTGDLSSWDVPVLSELITELRDADFDVGSTGWSDEELLPVLGGDWVPDPRDDDLGGETAPGVRGIHLKAEQRAVFDRAAAILRNRQPDEKITDGHVVKVLAHAFLGEAGEGTDEE